MTDTVTADIKKNLLRTMVLIRRFEEKIVELYPAQEMKTPVHLCIGQEAVAAGVAAHLQAQDFVFSTHRNHGHYLAKGGCIKAAMAELYGRRTGCAKGKGGSMHLVAPERGIPGATAIVGGSIPLAVGTAFASRYRQDGKVSVAFLGDGAADEGIFHESLNFAALKCLPVVFVCENNYYATNSRLRARQPHQDIYKRAHGYDIPGLQVDGNRVLEVYEAAQQAVGRAREGGGPSLLECRTYRWKGHVGPDCDWEKGCRPKAELDQWTEKCPIRMCREELSREGLLGDGEWQAMGRDADERIEEAVRAAKQGAYPDPSELCTDVYWQGEVT